MYIIVHVGTIAGFIQGAKLTFKAESESGDYHKEINADNFFKWVRESTNKICGDNRQRFLSQHTDRQMPDNSYYESRHTSLDEPASHCIYS